MLLNNTCYTRHAPVTIRHMRPNELDIEGWAHFCQLVQTKSSTELYCLAWRHPNFGFHNIVCFNRLPLTSGNYYRKAKFFSLKSTKIWIKTRWCWSLMTSVEYTVSWTVERMIDDILIIVLLKIYSSCFSPTHDRMHNFEASFLLCAVSLAWFYTQYINWTVRLRAGLL